MNDLKTTQVHEQEILESYAEKFAEFEEEFSDLMGKTVIDDQKLRDYLLHVNAFFMAELTKIQKQIHTSQGNQESE